MLKRWMALGVFVLAAMVPFGCGKSDSEKAADDVKEATEQVKDAASDAADAVGDAVQDAQKKVDE